MRVRMPYLIAGCTAFVAALMTVGAAGRPASSDVEAQGRVPVLVELFTSEGCSSCPPADEVMTNLVSLQPVPGAEIIALGEHVDYWDRLGWRDPFSSAAFSARQSEYASRTFHGGDVYTPQMVVNGREQLVGSDYRAAAAAIARAARTEPRVRVTLEASRMPANSSARFVIQVDTAGAPLAGAADVVLAITEDGLVTQVRRGENGGRELRHTAVTRFLTSAGAVSAKTRPWTATTTVRLAPAWNLSHTRAIAFVQDRATGSVLGAVASGI